MTSLDSGSRATAASPATGVRVEIPIRIVSVMNAREHHMAKARRAKLHRQTTWLLLGTGARPTLPCTVTLTRIAPRVLDGDNLQSGFKACRDGVADWLRVDDGDARVQWRYEQRKGAPKHYAVEVEIA